MNWISVKDRLPKVSFIESDDDEIEYEMHPILLFIPSAREVNNEIIVGWYEEEDLSPFPNIPHWYAWNGSDIKELETFPSHWMPLPNKPDAIKRQDESDAI